MSSHVEGTGKPRVAAFYSDSLRHQLEYLYKEIMAQQVLVSQGS